MRSREEFERVVELARQGLNRSEISRMTGVPRLTVSGWLRDPPPRHLARPTLTDAIGRAAYSYLLGMYLGDGHLARFPRAWCLRIVLDSRYPGINRSRDIHAVFTDHLDQLGIAWRWSNEHTISVARREAVARLDEFVGPKR